MSKIKLGCHVGMAGKEMFLASAKEAASYRANVTCCTQVPQTCGVKIYQEIT